MKKVKVNSVIALFTLGVILSSCNTTMHTVGAGGKCNCKSVGQYDAKMKQWYLFWGLLPLNKVDSKRLASGAKNYSIMTKTSFGDALIAIPGSLLLGLKTQTIRVSKGYK
jgi:hypothetical protein